MAWFGLRRRGGRHAVRPLMAPPSGVTITPHLYKQSSAPIVVQATTVAEAPFVAGPLAPRVAQAPDPVRRVEAVRRPELPLGLTPELASAPILKPAAAPVTELAPPPAQTSAVKSAAPTTGVPSAVSSPPSPKASRRHPAPTLTPARVSPTTAEPGGVTIGLFFDDGSHVVLDASDPRASAFTALAERLNN